MNRSAYLTTGLAIKIFSSLAKADIYMHGQENIPAGPTIFVVNHFTRVETFLLPYYIYNLTYKPVWSLAAPELFKGGLEKFFDLIGVVSTSDPKRDELIVKSLLTGEANWVIFPEGSMVKTKKIMADGKYMIAHPSGMHEPHTGAAALALLAELYRSYLLRTARLAPERLPPMLAALGIDSISRIQLQPTAILPVNLTYYPIRAAENIALHIASRLVKDMSERMIEEIMTEGTMMLSGVDLDIRFGKAIAMAELLREEWLTEDLARDGITGFAVSAGLKERMRRPAYEVMQRYMHDIYSMTTINHEHLFASFLQLYPLRRIREGEFRQRIYSAASRLADGKKGAEGFFLHKSLQENQAHLLTDDRYRKYANFLQLAEEKGVVEKVGPDLCTDRTRLSGPLSFHKGRIDNPVEIMANEVEPLSKLRRMMRLLAWQPMFIVRLAIARQVLRAEKAKHGEACRSVGRKADDAGLGQSFLLPHYRRRLGVILVHSYLAVPAEVKALALYLRRRGVWVYAPRLAGHGTSAEDLATRRFAEWRESVENGYVLLSALCDRVAVGGVAVGGNLALDLASRLPSLAGVFAVCPPYALGDYSNRFMPATDVWNRLLLRMKGRRRDTDYLEFTADNLSFNYPRNPVAGVKEVGDLLASLEKSYSAIHQPALIVQADNNPVVDPRGSKLLFDQLGSRDKEYCLLSYDRHVLVTGEGAARVFARIGEFIEGVKGRT